ncbi:MAG TPA: hypothetical protein VGR53_06580 [Nitrososphaerales archaeon]|nr:hypothetical protein [Nitrososphaerales archaeon]
MKWVVLLAAVSPLIAITIVAAFAQSSTFYLTSQLSSIRDNPDGSYYPGDSFQVTAYPRVMLSGG